MVFLLIIVKKTCICIVLNLYIYFVPESSRRLFSIQSLSPINKMLDYQFSFPPASTIPRCPLSEIDVLIVGGGIGGMFAAINCHQKGHKVRVLEAGDSFDSNDGTNIAKMPSSPTTNVSRRLYTHIRIHREPFGPVPRPSRWL